MKTMGTDSRSGQTSSNRDLGLDFGSLTRFILPHEKLHRRLFIGNSVLNNYGTISRRRKYDNSRLRRELNWLENGRGRLDRRQLRLLNGMAGGGVCRLHLARQNLFSSNYQGKWKKEKLCCGYIPVCEFVRNEHGKPENALNQSQRKTLRKKTKFFGNELGSEKTEP